MDEYTSTISFFLADNVEEIVIEALKEFDKHMIHIGGCTDGNCIIVRPKGMHTNGGCKCSSDYIKMQQFARATRILYSKLSAIQVSVDNLEKCANL